MMICEFGATHYSDCDRKRRPDFAALKIGTLYSALPRLYPRVKAINYFDLSSDGVHNDYSVTNNDRVREAYRRSIAPGYFLSAPESKPPPEAPLIVRQGELLQGKVALSCFARGPSDQVSVRYTLDGITIYRAFHPIDWPCTWDAASVAPGRHVLGLDVCDLRHRLVATQKLSVITAH